MKPSFIKIAELENQIEAQLIKEVLEQEQIPHYIRSYQDMAYNGIFAMQLGWGSLFVHNDYVTKALALIKEVVSAFKLNEAFPD